MSITAREYSAGCVQKVGVQVDWVLLGVRVLELLELGLERVILVWPCRCRLFGLFRLFSLFTGVVIVSTDHTLGEMHAMRHRPVTMR